MHPLNFLFVLQRFGWNEQAIRFTNGGAYRPYLSHMTKVISWFMLYRLFAAFQYILTYCLFTFVTMKRTMYLHLLLATTILLLVFRWVMKGLHTFKGNQFLNKGLKVLLTLSYVGVSDYFFFLHFRLFYWISYDIVEYGRIFYKISISKNYFRKYLFLSTDIEAETEAEKQSQTSPKWTNNNKHISKIMIKSCSFNPIIRYKHHHQLEFSKNSKLL